MEGLQIVAAKHDPRFPTFFLVHRLIGLLASPGSNLTDRLLLSFKLFVSTAACRHRAAWSQQSRMSAVDCMHMQCLHAACVQDKSHWYMEGNSIQLAVQVSWQHESGCHLRSICSMVWLSAGCQISLQPAVTMVPESVLIGGYTSQDRLKGACEPPAVATMYLHRDPACVNEGPVEVLKGSCCLFS